MKALVDTNVWSLMLRRSAVIHPAAELLKQLWNEGEVSLMGPVRQEILTGIRNPAQFTGLRDRLRAEPDHPIHREHYERAAEYFNVLRSHGIQGTSTDLLLCAVSIEDNMPILTLDRDFLDYARFLPIQLLNISNFA